MSGRRISGQELHERIASGDLDDPLAFLNSVMQGEDPREVAAIYSLVMGIDRDSGGDIPRGIWTTVVTHVKKYCKCPPVSVTESLAAGKALAEYLHPKRKHVETSTDGLPAEVQPLTEDEVTLFLEKFNDAC